MDFSYLKRPSNEQIGVWGVTTLFTAWIVNRRPELFLNPSTNRMGIALASAINGVFLTFSHNFLKEIFHPNELTNPQREKQKALEQLCDTTGKNRLLAFVEYDKAQSAYDSLNLEKETQIQKQNELVEEIRQRRNDVSIQLTTAKSESEKAENIFHLKKLEVEDLEQNLIRQEQEIIDEKVVKDKVALSVDVARIEVERIQKELDITIKEFERLEKEVPSIENYEFAMNATLQEISKTLADHKRKEQDSLELQKKLSAELEDLVQKEKSLKETLMQVEKTLSEKSDQIDAICNNLRSVLHQLKNRNPKTPDSLQTPEDCSQLINWVKENLLFEQEKLVERYDKYLKNFLVEQNELIEEISQRKNDVSIQLTRAMSESEKAEKNSRLKNLEIENLRQNLILQNQEITDKEAVKGQIALSVDVARIEVERIQKELDITIKEFERLEKEVPSIENYEFAMNATLQEISKTLADHKRKEQDSLELQKKLSAELEDLVQKEKSLKETLMQVEKTLSEKSDQIDAVCNNLRSVLHQLKNRNPKTPDSLQTPEDCSQLINWVKENLFFEQKEVDRKNKQCEETEKEHTELSAQKQRTVNEFRDKIDERRLHFLSSEQYHAQKVLLEKQREKILKEYDTYLKSLNKEIKECQENYLKTKTDVSSKLELEILEIIDKGDFQQQYFMNLEIYKTKRLGTEIFESEEFRDKITHEEINLSAKERLMFFKYKLLEAQEVYRRREESDAFQKVNKNTASINEIQSQMKLVSTLEGKINELERIVHDLDAQVSQKGILIKSLKKEISGHEFTLDLLKQISLDSLDQLKGHYELVQTFKQQQEKDCLELSSIQIRINEITRTFESLAEKLGTLNISESKEIFAQKNDEHKKLLEQLKKTGIFLNTTESRRNELQFDLANAKKQYEAREIDFGIHKKEIEHLIDENKKKEEKYLAEQNTGRQFSERVKEATQQVEKLQADYDRLNIQYEDFSQKVNKNTASINEIQSQMKLVSTLEGKINELERIVHDLDAQVSQKGILIKSLKKEISGHEFTLDLLKQISLDSLDQLKGHYELVQTFKQQQEKDCLELSSIQIRINEITRTFESLAEKLGTLNISESEEIFAQKNDEHKKLLEQLKKTGIFLSITKSRKAELQFSLASAKKQCEAREIDFGIHENKITHLIEEGKKKREKLETEWNAQSLSRQVKEAKIQQVEKLQAEYDCLDVQYEHVKDILIGLTVRIGVDFISLKQRAEITKADWNRSAQIYNNALEEKAQLEYALNEYKLNSKEIEILETAINALETQKIYFKEKSENPYNVLLPTYHQNALNEQRKYLELQIKQCRAQYLLAKNKREHEEYLQTNSEKILETYKKEQVLHCRLKYYLEKLFQHDKIVEWEEERNSNSSERLRVQIQDSIDKQTYFQKLCMVTQHAGFEVQEADSFSKEFKLKKADLSPLQDDFAILSFISLIEKCLIDRQINILDAIEIFIKNPPKFMEQKDSQNALKGLLEVAFKKKQVLNDKVTEVFALMKEKIRKTFKDQEQAGLLKTFEEYRLGAEPLHTVKKFLIAPLRDVNLENDPDRAKKSCVEALLQDVDQGICAIKEETTQVYQELQQQFRDLFVNKSQLRLLIAKLELLQNNQELFSNPTNRDLIRNNCRSHIIIADIIKQKKSIKQEGIKQILENQNEVLGKPPKKEDSQPNRIIEAISFIAPQIILLLLYKMGLIGKLLKNVGADIVWSAAWKTSIWTFAIHHQTSYLLERDRKA